MKTFILLAMLCFGIACHAQYANRQYAQVAPASLTSIHSFTETTATRMPGERMKNVGTGLTLGGSALLIGGIVLTSTTDFDHITHDNGDLNEREFRHLVYGIDVIVLGIGMTIPGIILWSKGAHKISRYKKEQHITLGTKGAGLSLQYHF